MKVVNNKQLIKILNIILFIIIIGLLGYWGYQKYSFKEEFGKSWLDIGKNVCINIRGCSMPKINKNSMTFSCGDLEREIIFPIELKLEGKKHVEYKNKDGLSIIRIEKNGEQYKYYKKDEVIFGFKSYLEKSDRITAGFGEYTPCDVAKKKDYIDYKSIEFLK